ncbi:PP2C family protein-serine/threonine phosphatase [Kitasatospora sp. GP82]|uniref:PP2C family protein-serine/threonine phosphatase n=1 Tax=Kitasatospora sp. GP82 TaxID=3035089 RepID=UPI0024734E03|nr:PP2C family protein-serine/threonine phosphatase [Kitasatospora sp. GP82]MDH6124046.1 serine phosphatase RsbU (regulator of sigma subunit) [Kitasatospora sp. GP82]
MVLGGSLLTAAIVAVDLATGPKSTFSPVLTAVPVLAGVGTRRALVPLFAGLLTAAVVVLLVFLNPQVPEIVHATAAAAVLAVALISSANVSLVAMRERELVQVRTVSETAQRALLRPVPDRVGTLRIAVRYLAAAAEARIGGDLYEVVRTAQGIRLLLGDVRGKGLTAVETAADVLGVFREAALAEPDLAEVAVRLDSALNRRLTAEDFVTAVLLDVPETTGPALVVNCGHPPPLLATATGVSEVQPPGYAPPLGLLGMSGQGRYSAGSLWLGEGDLLLLYTDGVSEARDNSGRFYPLAERLAHLNGHDPGTVLDHLVADVRAYVDGGLGDDAALLAIRRVR